MTDVQRPQCGCCLHGVFSISGDTSKPLAPKSAA